MGRVGMRVMEMMAGPSGGVSGPRALLVLSMVAAAAVFLAWAVATFGLFFGWWEWARFEGAIVSGGLGLLGVLLGSGGVYAANRFSFRPDSPNSEREWVE